MMLVLGLGKMMSEAVKYIIVLLVDRRFLPCCSEELLVKYVMRALNTSPLSILSAIGTVSIVGMPGNRVICTMNL